jgi:hypothetical protein
MRASARFTAATFASLLAACASSGGSADHAAIFSGNTRPACDHEVVGEVVASERVRGSRSVAEDQLHRSLARAATRIGGDAVVDILIEAPARVPVMVSGGRRPTEADLPAVQWRATGKAVRFTDPACRR